MEENHGFAKNMNEEEIIYETLDNVPRVVLDWDKQLEDDYTQYNLDYFKNLLPPISDSFVCVFQKMPGDNAGMYISATRAEQMSKNGTVIRPGIRINSKFREFTSHFRIVLLHEMIHACGINGHAKDFRAVIDALLNAGVYNSLL